MPPKTYRVNEELAEAASKRMIQYITKTQKTVTEAQVINASIKLGLENLTDEEIGELIKKNN